MGALPKRKISSHRQGKRRRAIFLRPVNLTTCKNCGKLCKLEGGCAVEPFREEIEG